MALLAVLSAYWPAMHMGPSTVHVTSRKVATIKIDKSETWSNVVAFSLSWLTGCHNIYFNTPTCLKTNIHLINYLSPVISAEKN